MAVRSDITINWETSPRLITVAAPSVQITIQDLVDTLRDAEDELNIGMQYSHIVNATGKQPLGNNVFVGITAELQDAQLEFAPRVGATYEIMTVIGGNLTAVDVIGDELNPINPTAFTQVNRVGDTSAALTVNNALTLGQFIAMK